MSDLLTNLLFSFAEDWHNFFDTLFAGLALITSIISAIAVRSVAKAQEAQAKIQEKSKKKDLWHKEFLSTKQIEAHTKDLEKILLNEALPSQEKCNQLNKKMFEFFYNVVDYVSFFDQVQYEYLKTTVMEGIDNIMFSVAALPQNLSGEEVEKILDVYRMKLTYCFYKMDIDKV
jgi:hypothetical protein